MTGKDIRDRADILVLEAYIQSKTLTDQCHTTSNTIKVTKKMVKANKKWTQKPTQAQQEQGFKFTVQSHNTTTRTKQNTLFVFGAGLETTQAKIISKKEDLDDDVKETRKNNKSENSKQNFKNRMRGGRINSYEAIQTERKNKGEIRKHINESK